MTGVCQSKSRKRRRGCQLHHPQNTPAPDVCQTGLRSEGARKHYYKRTFLKEDAEGVLPVIGVHYLETGEKINTVGIFFRFDKTEANVITISYPRSAKGRGIDDFGLGTADYLWERAVFMEATTMERISFASFFDRLEGFRPGRQVYQRVMVLVLSGRTPIPAWTYRMPRMDTGIRPGSGVWHRLC